MELVTRLNVQDNTQCFSVKSFVEVDSNATSGPLSADTMCSVWLVSSSS